jgi:hypothetical protein
MPNGSCPAATSATSPWPEEVSPPPQAGDCPTQPAEGASNPLQDKQGLADSRPAFDGDVCLGSALERERLADQGT